RLDHHFSRQSRAPTGNCFNLSTASREPPLNRCHLNAIASPDDIARQSIRTSYSSFVGTSVAAYNRSDVIMPRNASRHQRVRSWTLGFLSHYETRKYSGNQFRTPGTDMTEKTMNAHNKSVKR